MKIISPGQTGKAHNKRREIINYLISKGIEVDMTPRWGREYHQAIQDADVVLNIHGDGITEASNVRLFEVTGAGSLLLTDDLKGIEKLFEVGFECLTFSNKEHLVKIISVLRNSPGYVKFVAKNGQKRTLKEHTINKRLSQCIFIERR